MQDVSAKLKSLNYVEPLTTSPWWAAGVDTSAASSTLVVVCSSEIESGPARFVRRDFFAPKINSLALLCPGGTLSISICKTVRGEMLQFIKNNPEDSALIEWLKPRFSSNGAAFAIQSVCREGLVIRCATRWRLTAEGVRVANCA